MRPSCSRIAKALIVLSVTGWNFMPTTSGAADLRVTPSIRLGIGWDSNVFGTNTNQVSDFFTKATPELVLSAATPTVTIQLTGGIEGRWYRDNPEVSSWKYSEYIRLSAGEGWRPTERLIVLPALYYLETFDQVERALLITEVPSIPAPGVATFGLRKVRNTGGALGARYQISPMLELGGNVYAADQEYPGTSSGFAGSRTFGADVSGYYIFSARGTGGIYASANSADYQETPDSKVLALGFLGGYHFSPFFRFDGRIGVSFARQSVSASGAPEENTHSPAGMLGVFYNDNTFHMNVIASAGYTGLTGSGQLARQQTGTVDLGDQIAERWSWTVTGIYQKSRSAFQEPANDASSIIGSAMIRYGPWRWGSFNLRGNITRNWGVDLPSFNNYSAHLDFTVGDTFNLF